MSDIINLDAVSAGLRYLKLLRSSVQDLFKLLAEGEVATGDKEPKEEKFLDEVQSLIGNINSRVRDLESACVMIVHPGSQANISLGNTSLLGQDPGLDKANQYSALIAAYRWNDRVHEYASHANSLLSQNSLKRTHLGKRLTLSFVMFVIIFVLSGLLGATQNITIRGRLPFGAAIPRRLPNIGQNITPQQVETFLISTQRGLTDMNMEVQKPFGTPLVLKVTLERVMKAVIVFRGLIIEWILCKGLNEDFHTDDGRLDIWTESRYEVFRKVTDHANAAMLHFSSPIHPDIAVRSFLVSRNSHLHSKLRTSERN